jgi:hypothetical protein
MPSAAAERPRFPANSNMPRILRGDDNAASLVEAALSTESSLAGHEGTGDLIEHEQTFERFLSILVVAVQHVASCLVALIIGGVEGHWAAAMLFVAAATIAALAGAFVRAIGWKPGAAILALEVVTWLIIA